jgi:hypothetical protein
MLICKFTDRKSEISSVATDDGRVFDASQAL